MESVQSGGCLYALSSDENYDIALAMSSSRADPVLGHCTG